MVLRRWERSKQKFGFIKRVDKGSDEGLTLETSASQIFHGGNQIVAYAIGRLELSGRQNHKKKTRQTGNAQSRATFFRHSAAWSLPALLLRKLPNSSHDPAIPTKRISKCAEAFIRKFIDGYSYEPLSLLPNS